MRLNLGCGNIRFPTTRDSGVSRPYSYAMPDSCYESDDWVNVDLHPGKAVDQKVDLFDLPWPWEDNSVDEIWCSHLVEHIPHDLPVTERVRPDNLYKCMKVDGWYAFFYEAWRVLKPDGLIWVVAPYAFSRGAMAEPTHRRYLVPEAFTYFEFNRSGDGTYDGYELPYLFKMAEPVLYGIRNQEAVAWTDGLGKWVDQKEWDRFMFNHINRMEEFCVQLKAIKNGA